MSLSCGAIKEIDLLGLTEIHVACPPLQKLRLDPENLAKMLLCPLLVWLHLWLDLVWWLLGLF